MDTGADRTVISRGLAVSLKLPAGDDVRLHDTAGAADVHTVVLDGLSFGEHTVHGLQAAVLEAASIGAAGLLGIDSLRDQRVLMDFRAGTFVASAASRPMERPDTIMVYGRSRFGQLVLVNARADGQRVFVILDSGRAEHARQRGAATAVVLGRGGETPADERRDQRDGRQHAGAHQYDRRDQPGRDRSAKRSDRVCRSGDVRHFGLRDQPAMLLGMDVLHLFRSVSVDFVRREAGFVP